MLEITKNTRYVIVLKAGNVEEEVNCEGASFKLKGNESKPSFYDIKVTDYETNIKAIEFTEVSYFNFFDWIVTPRISSRSFMRVGRFVYDITDYYSKAKFIGSCILLRNFNVQEFNPAINLIRKFESESGVKPSTLFNYMNYVKRSSIAPYDSRFFFEEIRNMRTRMNEEQAELFKEKYEPIIGKYTQNFKDKYLKMLTKYLVHQVYSTDNVTDGALILRTPLYNADIELDKVPEQQEKPVRFVLTELRHEKLNGVISVYRAKIKEI